MNHLANYLNQDWFGLNSVAAPADVVEKDTHFELSVDMPGVAKQDLKIEYLEDQILVTGERKFESGSRTYARTFRLNVPVDSEKIQASYQDGVLKISVPKAESAKPRLIAVN